jgi:hypothetical protein
MLCPWRGTTAAVLLDIVALIHKHRDNKGNLLLIITIHPAVRWMANVNSHERKNTVRKEISLHANSIAWSMIKELDMLDKDL